MAKELDMAKYTRMFISEAREALRISNEALLKLESNPGDKEQVDLVFRNCHTIKGMASMMNMKATADTAHAIEDVLAAVRDGKLEPTEHVLELLFKGLDALEAMVSAVESGREPAWDQTLADSLAAVLKESPPAPKTPVPAPRRKREKAEDKVLAIKLAKKCALPAARALVIMKELEKTSKITNTKPSEDEIEREHMFEELVIRFEPGERYRESLKRIASMTDVEQMALGDDNTPRESWEQFVSHEQPHASAVPEAPLAQTVRVGMDKLDELLDDVGELVIGRSRLMEKMHSQEDYDLQEISSLIDKLTSSIQEKVLGIRMIPLDTVMSRYPRMVRDIAKAEGKDVELIVEGGDIELDRTVVDKITEPMMHLLRNCVDHGIETPEERERAGKRPKGMIRVVASKQQDHVLIEVQDDGRGIDVDSVREAAVSKGIMTEEQAANASARELFDLLFKPGFSTAKKVTEVSGRGVGLDVVKSNVEALGGSIMVNTSLGHGTTFSLWLPFTLAIIEAMLVRIGEQPYAVPMGTVVESHRYSPSDVKMIRNREVVQLRGEVLPLIRMRDFFKLGPSPEGTEGIYALIVQSRDKRAALEVDALLGHQQIVVKSLDKRLKGVKGISGGTILGSGDIALILDVESILGG
ncbi:MAG: chemotaxis protein CheA [Thermoplasmata archaeon]